MEMQHLQTWRDLLAKSIEDPQERQQIARELGVAPVTLMRWVKHEATPRPQNLQRLLSALPQHRELLLTLLEQEGAFSALVEEEMQREEPALIPSEFYKRVLHTCASIPKVLRFSSLCSLIVQQALEQLDPQRLGMAIIVARCLPPSSGNKVRSLCETFGQGTPPWMSNLEQHAVLLGAESLAGYAIITSRLQTNQNLTAESGLSSGYRGAYEVSAAAAPIMLVGDLAGVLLVSSTQVDYFEPARCQLIESYAELLALAFAPEEWYAPEQVDLGLLPPAQVQQAYVSGFQQQVVETMLQATRDQQPLAVLQAQQVVWQHIEAELLQHYVRAHSEESTRYGSKGARNDTTE